MRMLVVGVFGLTLCGSPGAAAVSAAPLVAASPAVAKGTVTSIDKDKKTFVVTTDAGKEITITYDDKTVWVLDGQISTREAVLKKDYEVSVRHSSGAAARVEGKPKKSS